jgi:hypothetical protein
MTDLLSIAKNVIGLGAPLLGEALGGPLGGAAGAMLGKILGVEPTAIGTTLGSMNENDARAAVAQAEAQWVEAVKANAQTVQSLIEQTALTSRAELASSDEYVRRARPTILYVFAFIAGIFGSAFVAALVAIVWRFDAAGIATAAQAISALLFNAGVFLGVVMVPVTGYVASRGREKQAEAIGAPVPGAITSIIAAIRGK